VIFSDRRGGRTPRRRCHSIVESRSLGVGEVLVPIAVHAVAEQRHDIGVVPVRPWCESLFLLGEELDENHVDVGVLPVRFSPDPVRLPDARARSPRHRTNVFTSIFEHQAKVPTL